jgi:hypothetical protein
LKHAGNGQARYEIREVPFYEDEQGKKVERTDALFGAHYPQMGHSSRRFLARSRDFVFDN